MNREKRQITLVAKEADKVISTEDMNFIYDLLTKWLIRDYMKKSEKNSETFEIMLDRE